MQLIHIYVYMWENVVLGLHATHGGWVNILITSVEFVTRSEVVISLGNCLFFSFFFSRN